tara:strand:- start:629 stop:1252 length:624 start_codon:yes stop_codon:yes gene_type:complete
VSNYVPPFLGSGMALGQYLERLRMAVNRSVEIRGDQDILVQQSDGGVNISLNPRVANVIPASVRWFRVTAVAAYSDVNGPVNDGNNDDPVMWVYTVTEVFKRFLAHAVADFTPTSTTTGPWRTLTGGIVDGTAYNVFETFNTKKTDEPQQATGVIHGNDFPSTFDMTPLKLDAVYPGVVQNVLDDAGVVFNTEILIWGPCGTDGTCS